MPWTRVTDTILADPAFVRMTSNDFRLYVHMTVWSSQQLTDGVVPFDMLPVICPTLSRSSRRDSVENLRDLGMVRDEVVDGTECLVLVRYLDEQRSKEQVLNDREKNRERQAKHRNKDEDPGSNADRNAVTNTTHSSPLPSAPLPSSSSEDDEFLIPPEVDERVRPFFRQVMATKKQRRQRKTDDPVTNWTAWEATVASDPDTLTQARKLMETEANRPRSPLEDGDDGNHLYVGLNDECHRCSLPELDPIHDVTLAAVAS